MNGELNNNGSLMIYQNEKGDTKVDVLFQDGNIWMTQASIAELYQTKPQNITQHIKHIYEDGELDENRTCKEYLQVRTEGKRQIKRHTKHYSFEMILAIGYRVRTHVGIHFRNWATSLIHEYTQKGFVLNDERLKNPKQFGEDYFDELLARIKDIRASEQRFYEKVKAIYATSIDYDKDDKQTKLFFKTVQNKMHYSVHSHTAAEIIDSRADATKDNMGLTSWKGAVVRKGDVDIAKNYLSKDEVEALNRIVVMYLDYAEDMAK
ncbi:MAG: virulence RhuM family protein, partial [Treponema sp.]|nr:virulence RhuM family protein [Treponema sp.]